MSLDRWPRTRDVQSPGTAQHLGGVAQERARVYLALRVDMSRKRACIVVGISERTGYRYERWARTR